MNLDKKTAGYSAMVLVVVIYGISYISRDIVTKYMHSTVLVGIQLLIMALLFTAINLFQHKNLKLPLKDILWLCFTGVFGTSIFQVLTTMGVKEIGPSVTSLLFGFAVVFALLGEVLFFKRKKTVLGVIGVIVSLIGVYILMGIDPKDLSGTNFYGYLLGIGSALSWVIYCFLSSKASDKYDKTVVLNYQAFAGALTTLPFIFIYPIETTEITGTVLPLIILNIIILGVFNATGAKFLNMYALKIIGVTMSNLMLNFLPVVTVLLAFVLYGELPQMNQLIGGLIIVISVFILNKDQENINDIKKNSLGKVKTAEEHS